jgi:hypothetical protein
MTAITLGQAADIYEPKTAKNITELQTISVDLVLSLEKGTNAEGEEYSYNYVEVNGERFRVPDSVLKDLKAIRKRKPTLKTFSVSKTGEGRQTKYTVIPLD